MHPSDELRRLQQRYAVMSDAELEALAETAYELTDEAQAALRDELKRRQLQAEVITQPRVENSGTGYADLVTIRRYHDLAEAMFAKSLLEDAGIGCFLADENTVRINWFYANAIGGMRLQVRGEDADSAIKILDSPWVMPRESDDE